MKLAPVIETARKSVPWIVFGVSYISLFAIIILS